MPRRYRIEMRNVNELTGEFTVTTQVVTPPN